MSDRLENLYIHHSSALAMYVMSIVSMSSFCLVYRCEYAAGQCSVVRSTREILTVAVFPLAQSDRLRCRVALCVYVCVCVWGHVSYLHVVALVTHCLCTVRLKLTTAFAHREEESRLQGQKLALILSLQGN